MILFYHTNHAESLEIKLSGAVTTNELPYSCSYIEMTATSDTTFVPYSAYGTTNGTTVVTVISDPSANYCRQLKYFSCRNKDTAAATLIVQANIAGTTYEIIKVTLAVGDVLEYEDANGWKVVDINGNIKVTTGSGGTTSPLTTKGDVWGYSTTNDRIPVGTDNYVLTADSTQALGVKWAAASTGSSTLLNGSVHTDTAAGTVARGDLITGQSATPKWTRLAKGTSAQILQSDGTDLAWVTVSSDVTIASGGAVTIANNAVTTAKINNAAVTLSKIQNASASSKLLGSGSTGSGSSYSEITLGTGLSMSGTTLSSSGATEATQAEMEAATSSTAMVTPRRVVYSPGVAKVWAAITWSGGIPSAAGSMAVSSITDNGTGDFTVNFSALSSTPYCVVCGQEVDAGTALYVVCIDYDNPPTTTSVRMKNGISTNAAVADPRIAYMAIFGDY